MRVSVESGDMEAEGVKSVLQWRVGVRRLRGLSPHYSGEWGYGG